MADINSDDKQEKRFIDPETGAPDGTSSSGGVTGSGAEAGNQTKSHTTGESGLEKQDTTAVAVGHSGPSGNIGGRGPGSPSSTIGDQDSTQARNDMDTIDPMTARDPGHLDKVKPQKGVEERARRDP